ncbi:hypothetical protein DYU11_21115 [Fibrisoma montanum]|uniref:Secretion system C-terminal sorting domain-containing protein n=1 Tax=Fibrisoma montanum TaxID=2305895 RepID=A0A418M465_9BACT|nr:T9SS type A sorting domain-containing protein [Fibrisoma montanum]RIV20548.1 hypothetical protein DYU11_21115 [Fibrisoma montanum]
MKNILITLSLLFAVQSMAWSQNLKVLLTTGKIEYKPEANSKVRTEYRTLKAVVPDGSGDYTYTWGASEPQYIISDRSTGQVTALLNEEDVQYRVFVEDKKTGKLGYAAINFKKVPVGKSTVHVTVYPNPSANDLTIRLEGQESKKVPTKVELFSEKSSIAIRSVPKDQLSSSQYVMSTSNLDPGVYYVHVHYEDEPTPQQVRVLISR